MRSQPAESEKRPGDDGKPGCPSCGFDPLTDEKACGNHADHPKKARAEPVQDVFGADGPDPDVGDGQQESRDGDRHEDRAPSVFRSLFHEMFL